MAVKITEWERTVSWGTAIEVTANKVINLLLRSEDNLIKLDENEIYVDLQLESWIQPSDTFPVGVTTGRVIQNDWWVATGTLLVFKTTSWDYVTWIYWDDGKLYIDNGTGTFKQIYLKAEVDALLEQLRQELSDAAFSGDYNDLINKPTLGTASSKDVWINAWNVPIVGQNWKLDWSIIPAVNTKVFTVTNVQDLTSLTTATQGDYGIVTSESKTYILSTDPYSTLSNWIELPSPTSGVTSVNGKNGSVTLYTNDIPVWDTQHQYVTSWEKNTWNSKLWANDVATVALTGNYQDLNNKPDLDGNVYCTQTAYNNLPDTKLTDWNSYFIYDN